MKMRQHEGGEHRHQLALWSTLVPVALLVAGVAPRAWSESRHIISISVVGGKPNSSALTLSGGRTPMLRLRQGEAVQLRWSSDRSMAFHLHGYNLEIQTVPGLDSFMALTARFAGRFPVETHDAEGRHRVVLYIEVHPR